MTEDRTVADLAASAAETLDGLHREHTPFKLEDAVRNLTDAVAKLAGEKATYLLVGRRQAFAEVVILGVVPDPGRARELKKGLERHDAREVRVLRCVEVGE
jgi:hypothetical protein